MTLSEVKAILPTLKNVRFQIEEGEFVPAHFHITEVGQLTKNFIDCGGTQRQEVLVNFQLWHANDLEHRLAPEKLLQIIALSEKQLGLQDAEVEVEYQTQTIGKYALHFNGEHFVLKNKSTACLALDTCGIKPVKQKVQLADLNNRKTTCCAPETGCC